MRNLPEEASIEKTRKSAILTFFEHKTSSQNSYEASLLFAQLSILNRELNTALSSCTKHLKIRPEEGETLLEKINALLLRFPELTSLRLTMASESKVNLLHAVKNLLPRLIKLNLLIQGLEDLSPLKELENLKEFSLAPYWNFSDSPLTLEQLNSLGAYLPRLEKLELVHRTLSQLEFLYLLPHLKELKLHLAPKPKLFPIKDLKKLKVLKVESARLADGIEFISDLPELTSLELSNCYPLDWTPLSNLSNLTSLKLTGINFKNSSNLNKNLPETLISLTLTNDLATIEDLKKLPNLTRLILNRSTSSEFSSIGKLTKLQILSLDECILLEDTNFINDLPNLIELNLRNCNKAMLHSSSLITSSKTLELLNIFGCKEVTDLPLVLTKLTRLKTLILSKIESPVLIDPLPNLRHLILFKCPMLENTTFISGLTNLIELSIVDCTNATFLGSSLIPLSNTLKFFKISGCKEITELSYVLPQLTKLKQLVLDIEDVEQLLENDPELDRVLDDLKQKGLAVFGYEKRSQFSTFTM